ncbi:MAG: ABC transporter permease [Candidatus Nanoarchaeia archaeon]|jgi:ABC-2 type transport system permease protein
MSFLRHFRVAGLVYKEFMLLIRRKKAPLLILILPILLSIIYSAGNNALANPQTIISVGVCNHDPDAISIINSLGSEFKVTLLNETNCEVTLLSGVKSGQFLLGVSVPAGFVSTVSNGRQGVINYYVDDSNPVSASVTGYLLEQGFSGYSTSVVIESEAELRALATNARDKLSSALVVLNATSNALSDYQLILGLAYPLINDYLISAVDELTSYDNDLRFVQGLSAEFLTKPVRFSKAVVYEGVNAASFNFASIFIIISIFTLLLLASTGIIFDKKSNYIQRIKASRTLIPSYLASKIIFYFTLSLIQFFLVMLLTIAQGAVFNLDFGVMLLSLLVITILNTSIGLLIGSVSENENVAILSSLMISLPFIFLSGIFLPLELMPDYIKLFANIIPLHKEVLLLKQTTVLGAGLSTAGSLMTDLGLFSLIVLLITWAVIKFKD